MLRMISLLCMFCVTGHADTIERYMNIVNNIPKMEIKADSQSQAWARSARTILALTSETVAESLILMNESATHAGRPLFCLPSGTRITPDDLNQLIQQTYRDISSQDSDKNKMTVSQVALLGLQKRYACQSSSNAAMKHVTAGIS